MLSYLKTSFIGAALLGIATSVHAADFKIDNNVMVDMEGAFSQAHSTPYIDASFNGKFYALDWQSVKTMIETNNYRGIPETLVYEACERLKDSIGTWEAFYNIGKETLPPANYKCARKPALLG